jgi:hypothetical protein
LIPVEWKFFYFYFYLFFIFGWVMAGSAAVYFNDAVGDAPGLHWNIQLLAT